MKIYTDFSRKLFSAEGRVKVKNVRRGIRKILNTNVLVKKIKPKYFFGFELKRMNDFYLPISTVEKTLIDLFYFKEWRKEYLPYFRKVNPKILKEFLAKYPRKFRMRVWKAISR